MPLVCCEAAEFVETSIYRQLALWQPQSEKKFFCVAVYCQVAYGGEMKMIEYRQELGIRQRDLAEVIGIDVSTVSRLEDGSRLASLVLCLEIERKTDGGIRASDLPVTDETAIAIASYYADVAKAVARGRA